MSSIWRHFDKKLHFKLTVRASVTYMYTHGVKAIKNIRQRKVRRIDGRSAVTLLPMTAAAMARHGVARGGEGDDRRDWLIVKPGFKNNVSVCGGRPA